MGWWTEHVVPRIVDKSLDMPEARRMRDQVCAGLHGRVLEIGFGSGPNVPHYPAEVTAVGAVEPSEVAWRMSAVRRGEARVPVDRIGLDGQRLDVSDESVDAVLSTFTLCTIPDADAALAEVARVLRPGGQLHFLEHGRSPDARVARWQDRLQPIQQRVAGGCHLDRAVDALVGGHLEMVELENRYFPGPAPTRPFGYLYAGRASRR